MSYTAKFNFQTFDEIRRYISLGLKVGDYFYKNQIKLLFLSTCVFGLLETFWDRSNGVAAVRVPRHVLVDRLNADFQPEFFDEFFIEGRNNLHGFGMVYDEVLIY